jgi:hypothetical protein
MTLSYPPHDMEAEVTRQEITDGIIHNPAIFRK